MQDVELVSIRGRVQLGTADEGWAIHTYGSLQYRGWVVVPQSTDLREEIVKQFHYYRFAVHPGGRKTYHDLRHQYYWSGMKRHVGILSDGVSRASRSRPSIRGQQGYSSHWR